MNRKGEEYLLHEKLTQTVGKKFFEILGPNCYHTAIWVRYDVKMWIISPKKVICREGFETGLLYCSRGTFSLLYPDIYPPS